MSAAGDTPLLTSPTVVRELLSGIGMTPSKVLGQNFLIDRNILNILVSAADLSEEDIVLEIGPGLGVVTRELLRAARRVVAVEKDDRLAEHLRRHFTDEPRLDLRHADMLDLDADALLADGPRKVVSNLPYSVGTRITVNLIRARVPPERLVVTVQDEVARRLAAPPGTRERGLTSVWTQRLYDVKVLKLVGPNCFWPKPDVKSAIVRMTRHDRHPLTPAQAARFYDLTRQAFMHRRKQMASLFPGLPGNLHLSRPAATDLLGGLGLDARSRPEQLQVGDWCRLILALPAG